MSTDPRAWNFADLLTARISMFDTPFEQLPSTPRPRPRVSSRRLFLVAGVATVALLAVACGSSSKSSSGSSNDVTATTVKDQPSCPGGDFDSRFLGKPTSLKLSGPGGASGYYVWFDGTYGRVRLVSDPAKPLATPTTKVGSEPVVTYRGVITPNGGKLTIPKPPDESVGPVSVDGGTIKFALAGSAPATGFDFVANCSVKSVKFDLQVPTGEASVPVAKDKVTVGKKGHPVDVPFTVARTSDSASTTTTKAAAAKATTTTKQP
jgi:hypothetical protein